MSEQNNENIIEKLEKSLDYEIFRWKRIRDRLIHLRELRQFLEVFSSEKIIAINNKEREITEILNDLAGAKHVFHPKHVIIIIDPWTFKYLKFLNEYYLEAYFFTERKWAEVYSVKPTFYQFLLFPLSSARFLIVGWLHKRMMQKLDNKIKKQ
jgi:hypothetical protein